MVVIGFGVKESSAMYVLVDEHYSPLYSNLPNCVILILVNHQHLMY